MRIQYSWGFLSVIPNLSFLFLVSEHQKWRLKIQLHRHLLFQIYYLAQQRTLSSHRRSTQRSQSSLTETITLCGVHRCYRRLMDIIFKASSMERRRVHRNTSMWRLKMERKKCDAIQSTINGWGKISCCSAGFYLLSPRRFSDLWLGSLPREESGKHLRAGSRFILKPELCHSGFNSNRWGKVTCQSPTISRRWRALPILSS